MCFWKCNHPCSAKLSLCHDLFDYQSFCTVVLKDRSAALQMICDNSQIVYCIDFIYLMQILYDNSQVDHCVYLQFFSCLNGEKFVSNMILFEKENVCTCLVQGSHHKSVQFCGRDQYMLSYCG